MADPTLERLRLLDSSTKRLLIPLIAPGKGDKLADPFCWRLAASHGTDDICRMLAIEYGRALAVSDVTHGLCHQHNPPIVHNGLSRYRKRKFHERTIHKACRPRHHILHQ